jgi:hypothetical protein
VQTNRGPIQALARQPDFTEHPGIRLDVVAREEVPLFGLNAELKLEARNLLAPITRSSRKRRKGLGSTSIPTGPAAASAWASASASSGRIVAAAQ